MAAGADMLVLGEDMPMAGLLRPENLGASLKEEPMLKLLLL